MSLFERIKNKRHNLTEQPGDFTSKQRKDNINMLNKMFGSKQRSKKTAGDVIKQENQYQKKIIKKNVAAGEALKKDIAKRLSASTTRGDQARSQYNMGDGSTIGTPEGSTETKTETKTKTKNVKQSEVSKDAKKFTDKINKQNKNRAPRKGVDYFFDAEKAKKEREAFRQGRKAYTDSKTGIEPGKPTKEGIKKYITKARDMRQGTNANHAKNKAAAEVIAKSSGKKYSDKIAKKYETDKRMIKSRKPTKTLTQLKKEIELKDLDKAANYRAAGTARSAELKDLTKKMGQKELSQRISQAAKLRTIRPQRQFYKGVMKPARSITKVLGAKQVAPAFKTGLKLATKAGPGGAIVAGTGLALLNPTIRAGAKKVAKAALGAAGIAAFAPKPKKMKIPKPTEISIGLSSGKPKKN